MNLGELASLLRSYYRHEECLNALKAEMRDINVAVENDIVTPYQYMRYKDLIPEIENIQEKFDNLSRLKIVKDE